MTKRQLFKPASSTRREPLLAREASNGSCCMRFGETVGSTTAECAAVICCCPCGLVNFLVLAAYKVPAGLCRRALRQRKRQKMIKQGLFRQQEVHVDEIGSGLAAEVVGVVKVEKVEKEVVELEVEMWDKFYSTGFWRSFSQRDQPSHVHVVNGEF